LIIATAAVIETNIKTEKFWFIFSKFYKTDLPPLCHVFKQVTCEKNANFINDSIKIKLQ